MRSALFDDEEMIRELIELLPVALFVKDATNRVLLMNKAFEALCGIRRNNLRATDASLQSVQMAWLFDGDHEVFAPGYQKDYEATYWQRELNRSAPFCRTSSAQAS